MTLPTGTVTFLFTDIEGSTRLAREHPEAWEAARGRHHAILRRSIESHDGYIFQIVGDAFCASFHKAGNALKAAIESQQGLQSEPWGEAVIRVRMGIHTGEAETDGRDYRGYLTLSLVQRLMSAGHGGQILVSGATENLLRDQLPKDVNLRDMGRHQFKDVPQAVRVFQVNVPDLYQEFPSLRTLNFLPNNLPVQLSRFIGREKEIEQIKKRLERYRLVTLTGSGGIGKTRLAVQVASELLEEYPNGVWLVELASVTDPSLVPQAVGAALDVTPTAALNVLTDYLRSKKILLVVDNCEHLLDACAQLAESLLQACPDLRILASSREALGIEGESAFRIPSLSLADPKSEFHIIEQSEAVRLFVEQASVVLPEYTLAETNAPTIAQICQRLDGIALAVVLAASRVKLFKVDQIAARLDDAFRLLTGGSRTALPRQQTLRGTIDWSYNLLTDEERRILRQLSVFVGGWTLEAAEAVWENENTLDLLVHLVDKSLVAVDRERGNEARYYLLETIRQYAREKLAESGEGEYVRRRHLDYFLRLAQRAEPELYGAKQVEWLHRLEDEHDNVRSALEWSLHGDLRAGQQLAAALAWSLSLRGHLDEGYEWLKKMLSVSSSSELAIRAKLLSGAGWLAAMLGFSEQSIALSEESIDLFRQLGDKQGVAFSLATLATRAYWGSDYVRATRLIEESRAIYREIGSKWGVRHAVGILGYITEAQGDFGQAQKFYEESLMLAQEAGDKDGIAWSYLLLGQLARLQGDNVQATRLLEEGLRFARETMSKPEIAWILSAMGEIDVSSTEYDRARLHFEEALEITRKMGNQAGIAHLLRYLGWNARVQRDYSKAQSLYSESLQLSHRIRDKGSISTCLIHVGNLMLVQGSPEKFAYLLGMAEGTLANIQTMLLPFFRMETENFIKKARTGLGDEAYFAAWEAGRQLSMDKAIAFAMKELGL